MEIAKQIKTLLAAVFLSFFVTLSVFPGVTTLPESTILYLLSVNEVTGEHADQVHTVPRLASVLLPLRAVPTGGVLRIKESGG